MLVGATTQAGMLAAPLRDRFGYHGRLGLYDLEALTDIVARSAGLLGLNLDSEAAAEIAGRAQGTPRIANRLLRRVRDWSEVAAADGQADLRSETQPVDAAAADAALNEFGVDKLGLVAVAREIIDVLCTARDGQSIGLGQPASMIGEDPRTVEEVCEPHLLKLKLIARTPRGRVATKAGYTHLGKPLPEGYGAAAGEGGSQPTLLGDEA